MAKATVDLSGLKSKSEKFIKYISTNTAEKLCLYAERLLEKAYNEKKFENDTYNLADSYFWVVFVDGVKDNITFTSASGTVALSGAPSGDIEILILR